MIQVDRMRRYNAAKQEQPERPYASYQAALDDMIRKLANLYDIPTIYINGNA